MRPTFIFGDKLNFLMASSAATAKPSERTDNAILSGVIIRPSKHPIMLLSTFLFRKSLTEVRDCNGPELVYQLVNGLVYYGIFKVLPCALRRINIMLPAAAVFYSA